VNPNVWIWRTSSAFFWPPYCALQQSIPCRTFRPRIERDSLVFNFRKSIGALRASGTPSFDFLSQLPNTAKYPSRLEEIPRFGSNPGNLRLYCYLPTPAPAGSPLVVVLHGCGQTAAGYDHGAGWSTLADRYGFALLMPEQQQSNNPNGCFNWFQPEDTQRGQGEVASINQMIEAMIREKGIDRKRVFVTGLSAGGAMTSAMLACYPDVFAAGAIVAGLPYGAATNVQQAFQSMFQCPSRSAQQWGDAVRAAAPQHNGPWPRVSVWHGSADKTVIPSNAQEIIKQWTSLHELPSGPAKQGEVDGHPRQVWLNDAGEEVIESYTIANMAHGTPLATGGADSECGNAGPFLLEVGISSSFHIARFFGLTTGAVRPSPQSESAATFSMPQEIIPAQWAVRPMVGIPSSEAVVPEQKGQPPRTSPIDIGAVITGALQAAGLMKR
jgi:poly(hydroxyalkanoate) depolymerase family esterase